jgi:hypothetical protein
VIELGWPLMVDKDCASIEFCSQIQWLQYLSKHFFNANFFVLDRDWFFRCNRFFIDEKLDHAIIAQSLQHRARRHIPETDFCSITKSPLMDISESVV